MSRLDLFVNEDRLRFDFTHFSAVTPEELKKVEEIVNEQIQNALEVVTKNLPIEEAKEDRCSGFVWREVR